MFEAQPRLATSTTGSEHAEREIFVFLFLFFLFFFIFLYACGEGHFAFAFAADHGGYEVVSYPIHPILMVHSPIRVAAPRAYDGSVGFTFNPFRELLCFELLLEFLIVDEFLIYGRCEWPVSALIGRQNGVAMPYQVMIVSVLRVPEITEML